MEAPTHGLVLYRTDGRNGLVYDLPAVVTVTPHSHPGDYPDGSRNPLPVPDEGCVHLTVFTPGGFGTQVQVEDDDGRSGSTYRPNDDGDFVGAESLVPGSGTYVEHNVPSAHRAGWRPGIDDEPPPRTWRVPHWYAVES